MMEFHVSRFARDKYQFDQTLFASNGNVIFTNFFAARSFAQKINQQRDLVNYPERAVKAGQINALGLIDEMLHFVVQQYREQQNPRVLQEALAWLREKIGEAAAQLLRLPLVLTLFTPFVSVASSPLPAMDCTVAKHLGTSGSDEVFLNRIVPWAGAHLGGVHVDTSHTPNRFYVFDSANSRILGFYGFRPANPDGTFPPADLVIGQPNGLTAPISCV